MYKAEFDHLTELLQTRPIESMRTEPIDDNREVSNTEQDKRTGHTIFNGNTTPSKGGLSVSVNLSNISVFINTYLPTTICS